MQVIPSPEVIAEELRIIWTHGSLVANGKSKSKTSWILMGEYVHKLLKEATLAEKPE